MNEIVRCKLELVLFMKWHVCKFVILRCSLEMKKVELRIYLTGEVYSRAVIDVGFVEWSIQQGNKIFLFFYRSITLFKIPTSE